MNARLWMLAILTAAGIARACYTPAPASAQSDDDALLVARVTLHEASWSSADAIGIYAVLRRTADRRGVSLETAARSYSPRFFAGTSARPWALRLEANCDRPHGFPLPWTPARRATCENFLAAVREVVAAPPQCDADDWGTARDHERARLSGRHFRMVTCAPGARNLFSHRLGRGER